MINSSIMSRLSFENFCSQISLGFESFIEKLKCQIFNENERRIARISKSLRRILEVNGYDYTESQIEKIENYLRDSDYIDFSDHKLELISKLRQILPDFEYDWYSLLFDDTISFNLKVIGLNKKFLNQVEKISKQIKAIFLKYILDLRNRLKFFLRFYFNRSDEDSINEFYKFSLIKDYCKIQLIENGIKRYKTYNKWA